MNVVGMVIKAVKKMKKVHLVLHHRHSASCLLDYLRFQRL